MVYNDARFGLAGIRTKMEFRAGFRGEGNLHLSRLEETVIGGQMASILNMTRRKFTYSVGELGQCLKSTELNGDR